MVYGVVEISIDSLNYEDVDVRKRKENGFQKFGEGEDLLGGKCGSWGVGHACY